MKKHDTVKYPLSLFEKPYKSAEDKLYHVSTMGYLLCIADPETGIVNTTINNTSKNLDISESMVEKVLKNFQEWGYIKKINESSYKFLFPLID